MATLRVTISPVTQDHSLLSPNGLKSLVANKLATFLVSATVFILNLS